MEMIFWFDNFKCIQQHKEVSQEYVNDIFFGIMMKIRLVVQLPD